RAQTGIGDGSVSVPHVAAKLAEEVFGGLRGRRALVIGAGDMSELVVKHLRSRGIGEVRIANRTPERARLLADRLEGVAVGFENIGRELAAADVVVSSTGSGEWIVRLEEVGRAVERRTAPLFFVDIAVPRDVDPRVQSLRGVHLYDIDDLQAVVERNACDRKAAAEAGEAMISPAVMEFMSWLSTLDVVPVIKEMRDEAEGIRRHELARALKRLDLSPEEEQVLEKMTHAIVNKLLHGPIQEVKSRASSPLQSPEVRRRLWEREGFEVELHGPKRG
ncbi:MAG: glutamyl-tRNA reductase, partial [Rubrobacteraceae bacterium]|nr:glutamyl-tRNA reductase [Rubrobacteraceae bacterium]